MFRIELTDPSEVDKPDNRLSVLYNMSAMYGKYIGKVLAKVSDFDRHNVTDSIREDRLNMKKAPVIDL